MIIVRTAQEADIDGVLELAKQAYPGMTTLPPDREVLSVKLQASVSSIKKEVETPKGEMYFLVMEDTATRSIVGTAAIIASLGVSEAFYSYKLNKVTQTCKELNKKVTFETLNLSNHFEGFSEVATLYLNENYRENGNGKFLARSRYLFMAQFRERFPESVMADLRGYFDEHGRSPFWDAVGRHFFDMSFADADLYGGLHGNQFIADLMPKHPLYVNMLPAAAQAVIGQPNVVGKPALRMLNGEGFRWNGHVDIFDAAPSVDTKINDIESVRSSQQAQVMGVSIGDDPQRAMICSSDINNFTTLVSTVSVAKEGVLIPSEALKLLGAEPGDSIRYLVI